MSGLPSDSSTAATVTIDMARATAPFISMEDPIPRLDVFDDFAFLLLQFLIQENTSESGCDASVNTAPSPVSLLLESDAQKISPTLAQLPRAVFALRHILKAARPQGVPHQQNTSLSDFATDSAQYLLRLRQLLGQQVHRYQAQQVLGLSSPGIPASVTSMLSEVSCCNTSAETINPSLSSEHTIILQEPKPLRNGRRVNAPAPPFPSQSDNCKGTTARCESPPKSYSTASRTPLRSHDEISSTGTVFPIVDHHAHLTLQLQQHLCQQITLIENTINPQSRITAAAISSSGSAPEELQWAFAKGLLRIFQEGVTAIDAAKDAASCAFREELMHVESVFSYALMSTQLDVEGINGAAGRTVVEVHELASPMGDLLLSSAPFCVTHTRHSSSREASSTMENNIVAALGKEGQSYATMAVAQHIWCHQRFFHQAFPHMRKNIVATALNDCVEHLRNGSVGKSKSPSPRTPSEASTRSSALVPVCAFAEFPTAGCAHHSSSPLLSSREDSISTPIRPPPLIEHTQEKNTRDENAPGEQTEKENRAASVLPFDAGARALFINPVNGQMMPREQLLVGLTEKLAPCKTYESLRRGSRSKRLQQRKQQARGESAPMRDHTVNTLCSPRHSSVPTHATPTANFCCDHLTMQVSSFWVPPKPMTNQGGIK